MLSNIIIVAAILLLVGPKRMQQIVIAALLIYCFPVQSTVGLIIVGIGHQYFGKSK